MVAEIKCQVGATRALVTTKTTSFAVSAAQPRVGRLSYVRRIAPELQSFAGNRKVIRRSLGLSRTNQEDPAVIQAWNRMHRESEELIRQAKAAQAGELLAERPQVPLTPRNRAGIAAEPWRQMIEMGAN